MRKSLRYTAISVSVATLVAAAAITASEAASSQSNVVNALPSTATPNIVDGTTFAITKVGGDIIVGGSFTSVSNRGSSTVLSRPHILAFNATTGTVETGFAPKLDGNVNALLPGPTADTVYVGGSFANVSSVKHPKLVLLSTKTGAPVSTFKPGAMNGIVNTLGLLNGRLFVGGLFTTVAGAAHGGLATMNATTGALDPYLNVNLAGHHNWDGTGAKAGVGASVLKISPTGKQMMVIGNFKTANGLDRDQGVMIGLGTSAAVTGWETNALKGACSTTAFDSWVRDVDYSPTGSYFVIDGTGGPRHAGEYCDSAMRFESSTSSSGAKPTWTDFSGGDTFLSVAVTGTSVYVGGHFRWLNNSFGTDSSAAGAVGRPGLAALDPATGLPLAWNPGRNPRGYGAPALFVDADGLYVGSDTNYIGSYKYFRGKIAYFPVAGGETPPAGKTATLPGHVYVQGATVTAATTALFRVNAGGPKVAAIGGGMAWAADNTSRSPYRTGGTTTTITKNLTHKSASLPKGTPMALFNSERDVTSATPSAWKFTVPSGTKVTVKIYYAQRSRSAGSTSAAPRQQAVTINGKTVEKRLDLHATFGYNTAGMRSYKTTSDGSIRIGFKSVQGSAEVSAIEIDRVSAATSTVNFGSFAFTGSTVTAAGGVSSSDSTTWPNLRGAFLVDNELYYGLSDGNLYKRSFNGTTFGSASEVDPYNDPYWDGVKTGSGTTVYTGVKSSFYSEITSLTSMFYADSKLYYTRSGATSLYWRWFTPDTGIVGADEFTVSGASGFSSVDGVFFIAGSSLYFSKTNGNLYKMGWSSGAPTGSAAKISGPGIDSFNWSTAGAFLGK